LNVLLLNLGNNNLGARTGCRYSPAPRKPTSGSNRPLHPWRNRSTIKHRMSNSTLRR